MTSDPRGTPHGARRVRLVAALEEAELDAVAVVPGPNMVYLTGLGFHLSERPTMAFLCRDGRIALLLPALEQTKAEEAGFGADLFPYSDEEGPGRAATAVLEHLALAERPVGVEDRRMRFLELDLLAHSGQQPSMWGADEVFASLRTRKDASEIEAMRRAAQIAQDAWRRIAGSVRSGDTEKDLASRLTVALLQEGSDPEIPFFPIIASGPNGALPHAVPTDRALAAGDLVTVDWGARFAGYCSDITRTFAMAGAPVASALVDAYEAVRAGNAAGRAAVQPGATGQSIDRAARGAIAEAGLAEYFVHRTGHGLGLEEHEEPDIKEGARHPLPAGATFTVEPGVYIRGVGGVRIEDDMLLTAEGGESLTSLPREMETLGAA